MSANRSPLTYDQIRAKMTFNIDYIDKEVQQQADVYQMIIEEACFYGQALNALEVKYETTKAMTELTVRKTFEASAIKATEGKVEAEVKVNAILTQLKLDIVDAKALYDKWYGLKKAWEMRQSSVDSTVRMMLSGYIAYRKPNPVI